MMYKVLLFILIILVTITVDLNSQTNENVEIVITEAVYKNHDTNFWVKCHFKNNGLDTVKVIRLKEVFIENNYLRTNFKIIGNVKKPYYVELSSTKDCPLENERAAMIENAGKSTFLGEGNIITIPPNERSIDFRFRFNTGSKEFCSDGEYFIKILYKPDLKFINDYQLSTLENFRTEIEKVIYEQEQYMFNRNLALGKSVDYIYQIDKILENHYLLSSLTQINLNSESIKLEENKK